MPFAPSVRIIEAAPEPSENSGCFAMLIAQASPHSPGKSVGGKSNRRKMMQAGEAALRRENGPTAILSRYFFNGRRPLNGQLYEHSTPSIPRILRGISVADFFLLRGRSFKNLI